MKDPLSSRPLTNQDVQRALEVADRYVVRHRDKTLDGEIAGRLLRLMLTFGPHISVLSGGVRWRDGEPIRYDRPLDSSDLRWEGGQLYLAWRRPKTSKPVLIPVPEDMRPWIGEFLDKPRWTRRQTYNDLLNKLSAELRDEGTPLKLTPSRFRHTAAVRLRKMGLLDEDIQAMLGIDARTMRYYINRTIEERTKDLKAAGWDHSTFC